jgi:hypothetical protein
VKVYRLARELEKVEEWHTEHGIRAVTFRGSSLQVAKKQELFYVFFFLKNTSTNYYMKKNQNMLHHVLEWIYCPMYELVSVREYVHCWNNFHGYPNNYRSRLMPPDW